MPMQFSVAFDFGGNESCYNQSEMHNSQTLAAAHKAKVGLLKTPEINRSHHSSSHKSSNYDSLRKSSQSIRSFTRICHVYQKYSSLTASAQVRRTGQKRFLFSASKREQRKKQKLTKNA